MFKRHYQQVLPIILVLLFLTTQLLGQRLRYRQYTIKDGLPHNVCYKLLQDSKGFIWTGTDDGLAMFDGHRFKSYRLDEGLPINYAIDVMEKDEGEYWIGTWGKGIAILKNDTVVPLDYVGDKITQVSNLCKHNGSVWAWSGGHTWRIVPEGNRYRSMQYEVVDYEGKLSFLKREAQRKRPRPLNHASNFSMIDDYLHRFLPNKGMCRLKDNKEFVPYYPELLSGEKISRMVRDKWGNCWLGARGKLIKITPQGKKMVYQENMPNYQILKLAAFSDGRIAFITELNNRVEESIYRLDPTTGQVENLGEEIGIASSPSHLIEDDQGNLWFSTNGQGIFCVFKNAYDQITTGNRKPFYINAIAQKNETEMWIGTKEHLITYDIANKKFGQVMIDQPIWTINNWENKLWFNTPITYDEELKKIGTASRVIVKDHNDQLISLHYTAIRSAGRPAKLLHLFLGNYSIRDARWDGDSLFVAMKQGLYLLKYNASGDSLLLQQEWTKENGLPANYINKIDRKGDTLCLATEGGGAYLINGEVVRLPEPIGVLKCEQVLVDHLGQTWWGTPRGLYCYDGNRFVAFNSQTGLVSDDVTTIVEDRSHNLWIGSSVGISVLNNAKQSLPALPPKLYIQAADSVFQLGERVRIDFYAINFETPSSTLYQYRLDGGEWLNTKAHYVEYNALTSGKHQFELKVKKLNSNWSSLAEISFEMIPPWYLHWVAYLFYLALFVLSVFLFASWRIRKAVLQSKILQNEIDQRIRSEKQLAAIREQIARDFHDEMGNKLASITVLSNLIKFKSNDMSDDISTLANKIELSSKELYAGTKDFIWAIKTRSDKLEELFNYLRNFGENFFHPMDIDFYAKSESQTCKLPLGWSRQVVLIFKEAMTNVGKYAECKEVTLCVSFDHGLLTITLRDNGKGFDEAVLQRMNGLLNMRKRAENINCSLEITSALGHGTQVMFSGELSQS